MRKLFYAFIALEFLFFAASQSSLFAEEDDYDDYTGPDDSTGQGDFPGYSIRSGATCVESGDTSVANIGLAYAVGPPPVTVRYAEKKIGEQWRVVSNILDLFPVTDRALPDLYVVPGSRYLFLHMYLGPTRSGFGVAKSTNGAAWSAITSCLPPVPPQNPDCTDAWGGHGNIVAGLNGYHISHSKSVITNPAVCISRAGQVEYEIGLAYSPNGSCPGQGFFSSATPSNSVTPPDTIASNDLAIDRLGRKHFLYVISNGNTGGDTIHYRVDLGPDIPVPHSCSSIRGARLAIDNNNVPHAAISCAKNNWGIYNTNYSGGSWQPLSMVYEVNTDTHPFTGTPYIGMDTDDKVHIVFSIFNNSPALSSYLYATNSNGRALNDPEGIPLPCSDAYLVSAGVAFGVINNVPHVAYVIGSGSELRSVMNYRKDNTWKHEVIEPIQDVVGLWEINFAERIFKID